MPQLLADVEALAEQVHTALLVAAANEHDLPAQRGLRSNSKPLGMGRRRARPRPDSASGHDGRGRIDPSAFEGH
jgi:hypothetical protein